jgi:hypothetical protein
MARVMDDLGASMARAWSWSAVLRGTFVALSAYVVLRYFGAALGVSTGDGVLDEGFAIWSVIAQILSLALGGLVAGRLVGAGRTLDGALAGLFTWAVAIVVMTTLFGVAGPQTAIPALWAAFLGAVLGAGGAAAGGAIGARIRARPRAGPDYIGPGPSEPPPPGAA